MADIEGLILTMVKPLVEHPDDVSIRVEETDRFMEYHLSVNSNDIGRVIGKQGRVAKAMRDILYSIRTEGPKKVRLTIQD